MFFIIIIQSKIHHWCDFIFFSFSILFEKTFSFLPVLTSFRSFKINLAFVIDFCKYLYSSVLVKASSLRYRFFIPDMSARTSGIFFYSFECYQLLLRFVNWLYKDWNLSFVLWLRVFFYTQSFFWKKNTTFLCKHTKLMDINCYFKQICLGKEFPTGFPMNRRNGFISRQFNTLL